MERGGGYRCLTDDAAATIVALVLLLAPNKLYEYLGFVVDVLKYWAKFSKLYGLFVVDASRLRYTSNTGFLVTVSVVDDDKLIGDVVVVVGFFVVVVVAVAAEIVGKRLIKTNGLFVVAVEEERKKLGYLVVVVVVEVVLSF